MNKKAIDYSVIMVIAVLACLLFLVIQLESRAGEFQRDVGDRAVGMMNAYDEGEQMLLFIDNAAKYSAEKAIQEMSINGGFTTIKAAEESAANCGGFADGYLLWNKPGEYEICGTNKPALYGNFSELMNNYLNDSADLFNLGYSPVERERVKEGLQQNQKDCLAKGKNVFTLTGGCLSCDSITECKGYINIGGGADLCKLDPCKMNCRLSGGKCVEMRKPNGYLLKNNYDFIVEKENLIGIATMPLHISIFPPPKDMLKKVPLILFDLVISRLELQQSAIGTYAVKPSFNIKIKTGLDEYVSILEKAKIILEECSRYAQSAVESCVTEKAGTGLNGFGWQVEKSQTNEKLFLFDVELKESSAQSKPVVKFALEITAVKNEVKTE